MYNNDKVATLFGIKNRTNQTTHCFRQWNNYE